MAFRTETLAANGRFAALLNGGGNRAAHDRPLLETPDWIVAPTLGAIVPNWLIVVPREPALNFRIWRGHTGIEPTSIARSLESHLSLDASRVVWFEHGPSLAGTEVGCGVDYAHLHFIIDPPFSLGDLTKASATSASLEWREVEAGSPYAKLDTHRSYLVAGSGQKAAFTQGVERTGSQFLRRTVANLVSEPNVWNYRLHPRGENVARTIATFKALEGATQRGG